MDSKIRKTFCKSNKEIDVHLERGDCALVLRKNGDRQLYLPGLQELVPPSGHEVQLSALCLALEDPELMKLILKRMSEMTSN